MRCVAWVMLVILLAPSVMGQEASGLRELEVLLHGKVPGHLKVMVAEKPDPAGTEYRTYLLRRDVLLSGEHITDTSVRPDPDTGMPEVSLEFDRTGAKLFEEITTKYTKHRLAIVLDQRVLSAPVIQTTIRGTARITLGATRNYNEALTEAQDLTIALRGGRLPVAVRLTHQFAVPFGTGLVFELDADRILSERLDSLLRQFRKELEDLKVPVRANRVPGRLELQLDFNEPIDLKKFKVRILKPHTDLDVTGGESETSIRVGFEPSKKHMRSMLIEQGVNVLLGRLEKWDLMKSAIFGSMRRPSGQIDYTGHVYVGAPAGIDLKRLIILMTGEARLDFLLVDDRDKAIRSLKDKLPEGIKMRYYTYSGPDDEPVTEAFLTAQGGQPALKRLKNYLDNLPEIEVLLLRVGMDEKVLRQIRLLADGGIDEEDKSRILELARKNWPTHVPEIR